MAIFDIGKVSPKIISYAKYIHDYFEASGIEDWMVYGIGKVNKQPKTVRVAASREDANWKEAFDALKASIKAGEVGDDEINLLERRILNATATTVVDNKYSRNKAVYTDYTEKGHILSRAYGANINPFAIPRTDDWTTDYESY